MGQNRGAPGRIQPKDGQMQQPAHQMLPTSIQSSLQKQYPNQVSSLAWQPPSPDKMDDSGSGIMKVKLQDNQMEAKPDIDSDRHKPPIPVSTISSQRG